MPSLHLTRAYTLLLTSILTPTILATCYRSDTHAAMDSTYTPCNPTTSQQFSMCYRSQVDAYGDPPDYACLPNGITLQNNTQWGIGYWRQSCTDPQWKSPFCLNDFKGCTVDANGNAPLTPCDGTQTSTTWCCGATNTACCGTSQAISIAAVVGASSSSSSSSTSSSTSSSRSSTSLSSSTSTSTSQTTASPTVASATTATPTASSTAQPTPSSGPVLSTGAKAGIAVGAVVGGLAVIGLAAWGVLALRTKRRDDRKDIAELHGETAMYNVSELEPKHGRSELPAWYSKYKQIGLTHEMPAS